MSDQHVTTPLPPGPTASPAGSLSHEKDGQLFPVHRSWTIATAVAVVMVLLALLGVGLTTTSAAFASTYWITLVPVYGLLCVGTAWLRAGPGRPLDRSAVIRQVLHWTGIAVALGLDFYVRRTGEESAESAGMNALLVLALGCFLAGVHLEWMFAVVGVLLTVTLIIVAKADQYLWLIFIVGAITIAVMLALRWMLRRAHSSKSGSGASLQTIPAKV